ncbi:MULTISPECIES: acyl-CoA dehydrogenase family protein [Paraburkholderia]|uniref:acyl-CoA dehydrogenase family protein n=1 Tax=Paraburkholderia TaxID=1822464 RepID=UPI0022508900|nr:MULTISPECIES: acyl-CoA dehydrogenase family protein [Paraburkholderia]MCX4160988.1 acyl-CoA dehydrogenase family protein [Paraburkholderia megapolitana]MDN7156484.1 acyl-CoA dehydrogenase family protein [Paraburkholderia sp. CHISQ3]MDQ6493529.1 acyl-CoA dehydrogenase family protein [Paraburkholderia megapolitana]
MPATHANSAYYTPEHIELQDTVRRFVAKEISPFVNDWDEAGEFPRELYRKAADIGLLGLGFPDAYGGIEDVDAFHRLLCSVELARCGSGGVVSSLMSHTIGAPPIAHAGSDELKSRVLPGILAGEKISALAITEPGGGSDVAALRTSAIRDGDHYIVSGEKVFITSGMRADYYTVAVRTDPEARGAKGLSLLVVEGDTPGLSKTLLKKMGWWASDTAHLHFDQCRVPVANLIGQEGSGFPLIMQNFNLERFSIAASALGFSEVCYEDALEWARQRKTFGQRVADHQVIRHKLVDMATRIEATRAWLEQCAWQMDHTDKRDPALISTICMLKNFATQTMQFCADSAVQILGGMGYMRGTRPERIYREVKVNMIGGGTEEIMKDLVARQLEF